MSDSDNYESLYCNKIGGKVWWYSDGGCEDFYNIQNKYNPNNNLKIKKKYRMNRYKRKQITKDKLIKLSKTSCYFVYYNEKEDRYVRWYLSGVRKYAKWCSDRAVRNRNDFSLKGAGYRKCFDYWWTIF
jgi:hypothetical protein